METKSGQFLASLGRYDANARFVQLTLLYMYIPYILHYIAQVIQSYIRSYNLLYTAKPWPLELFLFVQVC